MLHEFIKYFTSLHLNNYKMVIAFLGGSAGISVLVETFKPALKKLKSRYGMDIKKLIVGLLAFMSFSVSVAGDLLSSNPQTLSIIGEHFAWLVTLATVIYHFGASKTYDAIRKWLSDTNAYLETGTLPSGFKPKS